MLQDAGRMPLEIVADVMRRSDWTDPVNDRRLRREVSAGRWVRVTTGAYTRRELWNSLSPMDRHRLRVQEVARRLAPGAVISHFGAAAVWGMDVLGAWPTAVDVTIARATGGRSGGAVRRRALGLESLETVPWGRHQVTTPRQTAIDLARSIPAARAAGAVDQAIWGGRAGGPLTTRGEILELLDAGEVRRGDARARRLIRGAESETANVRESQARIVLAQLGFPASRAQERRVLASGRLVFGDRYFPEFDHWLEIDGRGKYLSPEFGTGRDPAEIVIDEKNRENEIRREVRGFSRLEATDLDHPRRVYEILTGDGLPAARLRP